MAKWIFYVLVFIYMCYRAVYGAKVADLSISVDEINYDGEEYLKVGTRKTAVCRAPNKNHKLEWVDPFDNVVKRIPSNRVYAQEHFVASPKGNRAPSLVLTFSELMVSDTGIYVCKSGEQKKSIPVCVINPSEFVDSDDTPTEVTIEAGRSITLACQAKGEPEPKLVWSRNDEELTEGIEHPKYKVNRRYKIEGYESLLTITDVEPEDAGTYYCLSAQESPMMDGCTNSDIRNITLQVNYKPTFSNDGETEYVYGTNNEVVDIKCKAKAWPTPNYKWFKDLGGDVLYEFNKSKIVFSENSAVLSVTAGPTTYGNNYKCTASNALGDTDQVFQLLRREKPSKADHIEAISTTSSYIFLNVSWDEEIYFPVDGFSIQYFATPDVYEKPDKSDWKKAKLETIAIEEDVESGDGLIIKLEDLEPETGYLVRVKAYNDAGEAPWSADEFVYTTNEEEEKEVQENETEETEGLKEIAEVTADVASNTGMFYGVFFTGAIVIVAVVCMFAMRLV